jgi:2-iminobutanoate/2-iminopropanoate deaminase
MHNLPSGDDERHPYSLIRTVDGTTGWCSGVLPLRPDGELETEPAAAIEAALAELGKRLAGAGASLADVVKVTVYLADIEWRPALDAAWRRTWEVPRPARTALQVAKLPRGALIELDAVVHRDSGT